MISAIGEAIRLIFSGDSGLWEIVRLTLFVSGMALLFAAVIGIPSGAYLGLRQFRGERWLNSVIYTGMGFPPVVVGLAFSNYAGEDAAGLLTRNTLSISSLPRIGDSS